jgi:hypothetical protein
MNLGSANLVEPVNIKPRRLSKEKISRLLPHLFRALHTKCAVLHRPYLLGGGSCGPFVNKSKNLFSKVLAKEFFFRELTALTTTDSVFS